MTRSSLLTRFLTRFIPDSRGVAAVEMALVAPAIAFLAFASAELWSATMRSQSMDEALRVSSQYYLMGGAVDADARQLGISAWTNRPADGQIAITRSCRCGAVVVSCTSLCPITSAPPAVIVKITATSTSEGASFQASQSRSEMVRVR